uniref:Uncharacterized protein n=1 Tax=Arundo donax TaxID=35708 RepID=A0A0A8YKK0_ARUDO
MEKWCILNHRVILVTPDKEMPKARTCSIIWKKN